MNFKQWCKESRGLKIREIIEKLNKKLRGYYEYYGMIGNSRSLREFFNKLEIILKKWLNRRSQRKSYTWEGFREMIKQYPQLKPMITERRNYQLNLFNSIC
jgi:RNA-directed DNA polymerase